MKKITALLLVVFTVTIFLSGCHFSLSDAINGIVEEGIERAEEGKIKIPGQK